MAVACAMATVEGDQEVSEEGVNEGGDEGGDENGLVEVNLLAVLI